jgi:hypothetical protein
MGRIYIRAFEAKGKLLSFSDGQETLTALAAMANAKEVVEPAPKITLPPPSPEQQEVEAIRKADMDARREEVLAKRGGDFTPEEILLKRLDNYVGATLTTLVRRCQSHKHDAERKTKASTSPVHGAWREYGRPAAAVLAEVPISELVVREQEFILKENTLLPNGYNVQLDNPGFKKHELGVDSKM